MSYPQNILWGVWTNEDIETIPNLDKRPWCHVVARSIGEAIEKFMEEKGDLFEDGEYISMVRQIDVGTVL
jgi:hypothetical protein